jgi:Nucleotidyl transferase AbiEii toxin, Type IV TA system
MKDFYDIRSLSRDSPFEAASLSEAIKKTFARRDTKLPSGTPLVFTSEFFDDSDKKKQWAAFCNKNRSYIPKMSLESVCQEIAAFLMPLVEALNGKAALPQKWLDNSLETAHFPVLQSAPRGTTRCSPSRDTD